MHSGLTLLAVSFFTVPISTQPVPETFNLTVPDGPISSHSGSSVDLLCQVSPVFNIQPFEVRWSWSDDSNEPALLYKDQKIQEALMDQRFRGRVSLTGGLERGNASLRLERVTLEDSGEFGCYIASKTWYDKASVVLTVSVIGSQPVISVAETRGGQVNITCSSKGWSPEPKVTWRNKEGTDISNGQEVQNTIDSQGLVSVSSSLLYSPSESEWLSCIVSLSDEWKTEGRILPTLLSGDSIEGFTVNQVLLVVLSVSLVIIFCALSFFIVFKQKGSKCSSVHKSRNQTDQLELGLNLPETERLTEENPEQTTTTQAAPAKEGAINGGDTSTEQTPSGKEDKDLLQGKKMKAEHITVDQKTSYPAIRVTQHGTQKRIQYVNTKDNHKSQMSVHVLGNEVFDSGQHYWQVKVKDDNVKEKLAWYLGVTRENVQCSLTPENGFWILFFEKGELGLHVYVDNVLTSIGQKTPTIMGVFLDCDKHTLSFYDADSGFHLYTFNDVKPTNTLYPVFSPGNKDPQPIKIIDTA